MEDTAYRAIAIVGAGAVLPDAPNVGAFWDNVKNGRYSITEVAPDRWDPARYYDPDPSVPDKTYSKIGGWVREYSWDPVKWRLPIPPRVADAMDGGQKWAIGCTREALEDYGYPGRPLNLDRTAVILGNAMAGEKHYQTALRIYFPEYARELEESESFAALPEAMRRDITRELRHRIAKLLPEITEDTMPGELANCIAGRVANLFNIRGPNYTTDAACASAMAAFTAAVEGLVQNDFDAAIAGGIDRNMGASAYVKFCKIGALSATGTRPYADGADGFVMGEGAAVFILKRLADAERDGDKIYAVLRGMGASSDGKGKGITAPNPAGQKLCVERGWQNAGLSPATATYFEGHGTSTRVGDVVEANSLAEVLSPFRLSRGAVALGSVKSNIGHLKGAAGAAGMLKTALALRDKVLPPSINCERPNPGIDFEHAPFQVNRDLKPWTAAVDGVRRAGVSAFGFGGTNFHAVLEEYIPHRLTANGRRSVAVSEQSPVRTNTNAQHVPAGSHVGTSLKAPLRGALLIGAASVAELSERLRSVQKAAGAGRAPVPDPPLEADLRAPERIAVDYADASDLADKSAKALKALAADQPAVWKALRAQGVFRGHGPAPKVAFLYTGQGSQYVNMLRPLRAAEPIVEETFAEADRTMTPLLGKPVSDFVFVDAADPAAVAQAEDDLRQTAITQPVVLAIDTAMTRLLAAYGIQPDMTMGHSLGEYGALVAAGALRFEDALVAVSARGRGMTEVSVDDNGRMAAVFAPLEEIERILKTIDGYVVIANINSQSQAVIGGASEAVGKAIEIFLSAGYNAVPLPVSHAFHTSIVAGASVPLRRVLERLNLKPPRVPVVANTDGEFYPMGPDAASKMVEILARQVASPVQFVKGLNTLYDAGARVFVEVGPKKALQGFAEDVLGNRGDVLALFTNHPKFGDVAAFNQALCGLYAMGLGCGDAGNAVTAAPPAAIAAKPAPPAAAASVEGDRYAVLGHLFADVLDRALDVYGKERPSTSAPVTITGAALGLPGTERIFDDGNVARILRGEQFIDVIPTRFRRALVDKHITRLVKSGNNGPSFEAIDNAADVLKLAGRGGAFDLQTEFGISADRLAALDRVTQLAIAAGIDALRDAGIPLVLHYKNTTTGTQLPDGWGLPEALRDDTGVIFASCWPGSDSLVDEMSRYHADHARREQLDVLENLRARAVEGNGHSVLVQELDRRIGELRKTIEKEPYLFDRRFLFRTLSMGHSQFAEFIGARGPNTQVNAACASTTQAIALAEDWIRAGRCRRVAVIAADDVTSDHLLEWMGAGFLATGAATTLGVVEDAALPFDRRRNGMILGMGAAGVVVESADAVRERGILPICELLSAAVANSAFHGTRLDVEHIGGIMENLVSQAEARSGVPRQRMAEKMVFVSHETYTPARGGSAAAEIHALRRVFGDVADRIIIANTKGFTGHAMGAGIEDVVAAKALETGCVPPVANFREADPELGALNLSKGGAYPVEYALRLGAGFGSQICMTLLRWTPPPNGVRPAPDALGFAYRIADVGAWNGWLSRMAGRPAADLEVVHRTLRVRDQRPAAAPPSPISETLVVAPTATPAPLEAPMAAAPAEDPVKERVLALVSEKTGYPTDMLALDLDLEADLGVDTVKQAEVFAAVRETYGIARDEQLKLRDFPTLAHVIRFVHDRRPDLVAEVPASAPPAPAAAPAFADDPVKERILAVVSEKTGYPTDMLALDLDLEADLGVDTVKQAEVFAAVREAYGIARDEQLKLRDFPTLAHVIGFVHNKRPDLAIAPAAAAPPPAVTPPSVPAPGQDLVKEKVLQIVAEKTGYPTDMLDVDLDLEADLGIDTVKQAEMFASVRAAFDIPRDAELRLRDFPTLNHVIRFARERSGVATPLSTAEEEPAGAAAGTPVLASLESASRIPRRVPVPNLRPPLEVCKSSGVALHSGQRVVILPDKGGVAEALAEQLTTIGVETLWIDGVPGGDELAGRFEEWLKSGPVSGIYCLSALDDEGDLASMNLAEWREALRVRVKSLYAITRLLYEHIAQPGTFLVSATRMGGQHGYDEAGAVAPLGGAVTGFTKTYKRERTDVLVKAVDFETERTVAEVSRILMEETLRDPGAVEIGYHGGQRWTIGLQEQPAADGQPGLTLDKNSVFVVTGAAGSIVSAITADLAAASGGVFYLLDLTPEPDPANTDLERFVSDREGLKRDLFARMQARGERATPAMVEKELAALERSRAALTAIQAVRASGGAAHYFSVDLTDAESVANVIAQVRARSGRVDVLLHAAGMERSHFLPDKVEREFNLVFDVKADGWFNLLRAIGDMPLGATVVFSSIAARFGNAGQADYSAANDLLCKIASNFRRTRPGTRAIAIDWTAWGGIGMAARGSIPKMMELAGIDMLSPEAGVPLIRRELTAGGARGELVVAERLGILLSEWDPTGGLDAAACDAAIGAARGPMLGKIAGMGLHSGLVVETTLDPAVQAFLNDHRIDGTPVLPGVMGIEAFAEAAACLLPGWHVDALEDVNFLAPFKFYRDEPRTLTIRALFYSRGDALVADCQLNGVRQLPNQAEPQVSTHFTARVRLTKQPAEAPGGPGPGAPPEPALDSASIYKIYFHGPAYQVLERAWLAERRIVGQMPAALPPHHHPPEQPLLMAPRLIELCLQTAGIWEMDAEGQLGLPLHADRVRLFRAPNPGDGPLFAVVEPGADSQSFDARVVDPSGNCYVQLSGYRTVSLSGLADREPLKALHAAMA